MTYTSNKVQSIIKSLSTVSKLTGQFADKLAVSQVADWITRGLVTSPTATS